MSNTVSNTDKVIDSRDLQERITHLEAEFEDMEAKLVEGGTVLTSDDIKHARAELEHLVAFAAEFEQNAADYAYGAAAIHESYFVEHIRELIYDCYDVKESNEWPYRHMKLDYEAAADEAKCDYTEIDFNGETYLVRS